MRHCQYEPAAARTYWRRLELFDIVPLTYDRFLKHARGTIIIRKEPLTFETILKGTMNLRSTDPRDKIYEMLGLVSDKAREVIPVSYSKLPEWTFVPTMAYIIRHEPDALALLGLLWARRPGNIPFPSWVVDFTISADPKNEHSPALLRGSCVNVCMELARGCNYFQRPNNTFIVGFIFRKNHRSSPFCRRPSNVYQPAILYRGSSEDPLPLKRTSLAYPYRRPEHKPRAFK
jgi:hypothetical protein